MERPEPTGPLATSLGRSRHKVGRGYTGPLPEDLWLVLETAWQVGIAVSSNFARHYSAEVALAASLGWVSSISLDGLAYTRTFNITAEGVSAYQHWRNEDDRGRSEGNPPG